MSPPPTFESFMRDFNPAALPGTEVYLCGLDTRLISCRRIRERDLQTPIIIHSAAARESDIGAAMEAGADEYLIRG